MRSRLLNECVADRGSGDGVRSALCAWNEDQSVHGPCAVRGCKCDCHDGVSEGAELIAQERERQISVEGYTDDERSSGVLLQAAIAYAILHDPDQKDDSVARSVWPWLPYYFKPRDPISDLTRAGALIAAAIDRRMAEVKDEKAVTK